MHNTIELNADTAVSVRPGANGMVELVFLGSQDECSTVVRVYPAQARTILDGLAAPASKTDVNA